MIGGHKYPVVKIGNSLWIAENLDYKFNVNGSQIPLGQSGAPTTPSAWYWNNDEASYGIDGTYKCGLLYNWYAVKYLEDNKETLLPNGWHVATNDEFEALANTVGGTSVAGTKLKAVNNSVGGIWPTNWNGTNDFGFSALPSGGYGYNVFNDIGVYSIIWTINEVDANRANRFYFSSGPSMVKSSFNKDVGYVVRLVKDAT